MRKDVFSKYSQAMLRIIKYTETDKNGNQRKCVVSEQEAKKHPERYKIYEYTHPNSEGKKLAYDPEIVKKFTYTFKKLCSIIPQLHYGFDQIPIGYLINDDDIDNPPKAINELLLGETFLVMAKECDVIEFILHDWENNPGFVSGTLKEPIPTSYKMIQPNSGQEK